MALATVKVDIAPIFEKPDLYSNQLDEIIYGMSVNLLKSSDTGWSYVRTSYGIEGYAQTACLVNDADVAAAWVKYKKQVVLAPYVDVQFAPQNESARIVSLPRAAIVVPLGAAASDGWQKTGLADGTVGYTKASYLGEYITDYKATAKENVRWNLAETALSYVGSAYRNGGRTPLGIDAVGLAAMSYVLNGITIPRTLKFAQGGVMQKIDIKNIEEGDLIYFTADIGVYIGASRFVHTSSAPGSEGVKVSSLRSKDDNYNSTLAHDVLAVASIF